MARGHHRRHVEYVRDDALVVELGRLVGVVQSRVAVFDRVIEGYCRSGFVELSMRSFIAMESAFPDRVDGLVEESKDVVVWGI